MYLVDFSALLCCCLWLAVLLRKRNPLPPGPRGWPIFGNLFDVPKEKAWLSYTEWGKTYGDIMSFTVFGRTVVVLNSTPAALKLLHRKSSIYSDRPYFAMGGDLVGWDHGLALTRYGPHFRQRRRLLHQLFSSRQAQALWPMLQQETAWFLNRLLDTPDCFIDHIRCTAAAIALRISHGYTVSTTGKDHMVAIAETALEQFSLSTATGAFLVDLMPFLRFIPSWFPGAGFHKIATEWRKDLFRMANTAHEFTKDEMAKGTAVDSFTSEHLQGTYTEETEFLVKWTAMSIYSGGSGTTVSATTSFFLAMCTHPHVQATAQAELDTVIGRERLPTMNDRPSLPYINAIMKEVLRWGPSVPGGVPHRLTEDDICDGYRIPAGSTVIANIWGMTHNPDVFPKPDEFRPERFFEPNNYDATMSDPLLFAFGFGRRICPGQHLAEPSLFLSIAMTLAVFTISKTCDPFSGKVIEPSLEWLPGTISQPKPFPCNIKPRFEGAVDLIQKAARVELG